MGNTLYRDRKPIKELKYITMQLKKNNYQLYNYRKSKET